MKTALSCLLGLLLTASCSRRDPFKADAEPTYNGTKLSAWLSQVQDVGSGVHALTEPAKDAVRNLGTNALPWLTRELIADESQAAHFRHYAGYGGPSANERNDAALRAFCVLGPAAAPAVTNLARIFQVLDDYSNARYCAITALRVIGPQAVPVLLTGLKHPDARTRENCALALGAIQPPATDAVPDLLSLLSDADPEVRAAAAHALGQVRADAQTVVLALLALFQTAPAFVYNPQPRPYIVVDRVGTLKVALLKPPWVSAAGKAQDLLTIQVAAAEALGRYGPNAKQALADFRAYLQKPEPTDVDEEITWRNVRSAIRTALPLIAGPTTAPAP